MHNFSNMDHGLDVMHADNISPIHSGYSRRAGGTIKSIFYRYIQGFADKAFTGGSDKYSPQITEFP
jgi:hypothetical protein